MRKMIAVLAIKRRPAVGSPVRPGGRPLRPQVATMI